MNFNTTLTNGRDVRLYARILLKLKLTLIILTTVILQAGASGFAQITMNEKSASLESILNKIRKQTGYDFFYSNTMLDNTKPISINVKNASIEEVLKLSFKDQPLTYTINQNTIVLRYTREPEYVAVLQMTVNGKVIDENDRPVPGATIRIKGDRNTTAVTDALGVFRINVPNENAVLSISYIGFETREVPLKGEKMPLTVKLIPSEVQMKSVVVTGTGINRNKDSFTGTTTTFTGEELKAISNNNVIEALKTLEPAFQVLENNLEGSNPNALPVIEVRGKSSIPGTTLADQFGNDPNQPLFVLDGFPTTLRTVVDLDINRVASITILKDAASTALYGSQASNGVVVIETIKPKPGELRFTYTQDFRLEFPDISDYNMMNAAEKLEFERLAGRYTVAESNPTQLLYMDQLYNDHLAAVQRGVDSYWLSEPLRNGYSTNSSINASGGDAAFLYSVGMNYRTGGGTMKGDRRDSYTGSVNLTYRKKALNINNITYIRGNSSLGSPYGSFSNFVNANPYFEKNYTDRYLEESRTTSGSTLRVTNPLYDAIQPQYNKSNNIEVQNNLNANIDLSSALRLTGGLQITKGTTASKSYRSPEMGEFLNTPTLRKGRYTDSRRNNFSYQANMMLTFHKAIGEDHSINVNWRNSISANNSDSYSTIAEGFPEGNLGNPRFAYSYTENGSPSANMGIYRNLNTTLAANYAFKSRYLADFTYRIDGSTAYGRNKQYTPYYSVGLGWNLHHEEWIKNTGWINQLRLTSNIGVTGNQNFSSVSSVSIYDYNSNTNYNAFGQGLSLSTLGNPDLKAQKTQQWSSSLDYGFFKNRLSGYINYYVKTTDPLVVPVDMPSSTGVFSYPYNVGEMTYKGGELRMSVIPVQNLAKRIQWTVGLTAQRRTGKYGKIGNSLATLNKQQENNTTFLRFVDGNSPEAMWMIRSLGIDPATGREIFLTKDGQQTFDYSTGYIVNVGNSLPWADGVISTSLRYKNFNASMNIRYIFGKDIYNSALANKVENITLSSIANNQDRRALYDRWKNPGDVTQFKGISQTAVTQKTSRFVQTENTFSSESFSFGYTADNAQWVKSMGFRSLGFTIYGNDFLYLSTIKRERGIDYPFARSYNFTIRAGF